MVVKMTKDECRFNLKKLEDMLEEVRDALDKPVKKYRTKQYLIRSKYLLQEQIAAMRGIINSL